MTYYDIVKPPALGRDRLSVWGIPQMFHGATLVTSAGPAPAVATNWVVCAREGRVFERGSDTAGLGLTVIGDLNETDALISAIIQDLLRQPQFRQAHRAVPMGWCRWLTAAAIHRMFREDTEAAASITATPLLVVSPVVISDYWALPTLADLLISRSRAARPTLVALSRTDYRAVQGMSQGSSVHEGLRQIIGYANEIVEL